MDAEQRSSILMFPWVSYSHVSPFLELAKTLSERNFHVYFCSTPVILDAIRPKLPSSSSSIQLVELHLSSTELPPHLHTAKGLPPHHMSALKKAFSMAADNFGTLLQTLDPDLVIYDSRQPWAPQVASSFNIPAINFINCGALLISHALHSVCNPGSEFPFSDVVRHCNWKTSSTAADGTHTEEARRDGEDFVDCIYASCNVILINSFRELEGKYIDYLSLLSKKKVVPIGPLVHEPNQDEADYSRITNWLDKKEPYSTVFVSFGSEYFLSKEEMEEIAHGLELSEVNFIWVVRFSQEDNSTSAIEDVLPAGFLERVGERGMVVKDWAPQPKILNHRNTGGFVSHCGWNSVMESMMFGVPIIAIPIHMDQPYNAGLVEETGVGMEAKRDCEGRIQRDEVARLIREVVVEKIGEKVRKKAREMSEITSRKGSEEKIDDLVGGISALLQKV